MKNAKDKALKPHEQRLLDGKIDLDKRINALVAFVTNADKFATVSERQQELLGRQLGEMQKLQITLFERLEEMGISYANE